MAEKIFITGIDTEVGKTVVSSIFVAALGADYWKPVQAGDLDNTDTMKVKSWSGELAGSFHEEGFALNTPASPHLSAKLDGVSIELSDFNIPVTDNSLVIEGAGGLMVPLNEKGDFILDLLEKVATKIVLVSKNYLGSINHTLSSFEVLKTRGLKVDVLVFSGEENQETEKIIIAQINPSLVLRVPQFEVVDNEVLTQFVVINKDLIVSEFN